MEPFAALVKQVFAISRVMTTMSARSFESYVAAPANRPALSRRLQSSASQAVTIPDTTSVCAMRRLPFGARAMPKTSSPPSNDWA